jgi:hypothetical protein
VPIETDRKLEGLISTKDLFFEQFGFEVYPFLKPVVVDGVVYAHYFCSGVMGRPVTTAKALLTKLHHELLCRTPTGPGHRLRQEGRRVQIDRDYLWSGVSPR